MEMDESPRINTCSASKCSGVAQVRVRIGKTAHTHALMTQPSAKARAAKHFAGPSRSKAKGHALLGAATSASGRRSKSSKPGESGKANG